MSPEKILDNPDPLPKGRLTVSGRKAYMTCPAKHWRSDVLGERGDPAPVLIRGSVVHNALQFAAREQLDGHARPTITKMIEFLVEDVKGTISGEQARAGREIDWPFHGETAELLEYEAKRGLSAYEREVGHTLVPREVEELFRFEPPNRDYAITGKKDITTVDGFVRDYKLKGAKMDPLEARMDDQLKIYQLDELYKGRRVNGLAFDAIVLTKEVQIQAVEVPPFTQEELENCLIGFDQVVFAIRLGVFPQANTLGSCRICGHFRTCQPEIFEAYRAARIAKASEKAAAKAAAEAKKKEDAKEAKLAKGKG